MKNFVEELRMSAAEFNPPVRSLMDIDFYKFTMGQVILEKHPDVIVTFKLIVRDNTIPIGTFVTETELRKCLDYVQGLRFEQSELSYLRGLNLFNDYLLKDKYIQYLRTLRLPPYHLRYRDGTLELTFTGRWVDVTMWETIALAIISELYYRAVLSNMPKHELEMIYDKARVRMYGKFETLLRYPGIKYADFGQRRRHSFSWQDWVVGTSKAIMGTQFMGTSNTRLALRHNLTPVGTNAHEKPMIYAALADTDQGKIEAQYHMLKDWEEMYGQGLRIILPDTYTSEQFYRNAPEWVASWRGMRQDSGNSEVEAARYIAWLEGKGINPKEKLIIFSDGLDVDRIVKLYDEFSSRINVAFGWGTLLTNDFRGCHTNQLLRPFSMVCKVVEVNGRPCVKLSDNVNKATGSPHEIERYKKIFNVGERVAEMVYV